MNYYQRESIEQAIQSAQKQMLQGGIQHQAAQSYSQIPPPPQTVGVISMTEAAHSAFQQLCDAVDKLSARLGPITESYPEPVCNPGCQSQVGGALAVVGLQILVDHINGKTADIYRLTESLRV